MTIDRRQLFPTVMFVLAGISFVVAGLEYMQASALQSASQKRMAFILSTIERSTIARPDKISLYATIADGLPAAPGLFRIDVSGSFASTAVSDHCSNEGQRTMCAALISERVSTQVREGICGVCNPK
ncbi:MAG: hypothetical protein KBC02_01275 [Candidatus Pacebacteria bacterium]|nr:hypothetical protein [Candidatus Paceibacterota bacterium]